MDEELDRICQNCSYFIQDQNDYSIGVCVFDDPEFEPYLDEICGYADFSNCYEIYLRKQYNGDREACDNYEEPELIELPEGMDLDTYLRIESKKYQNLDELIRYLYSPDIENVRSAISILSEYFYLGNEEAYKGLLKYYTELGPAESLEDVYLRKTIIKMLSFKEPAAEVIEAYVNELERTPSNNTTRQLYTLLIDRLSKCPGEIVEDLVTQLLDKKQYGSKIRQKLMKLAFPPEQDDWPSYFIF